MPTGYGIAEPTGGSGLLPWSHVAERVAASRNYWIVTADLGSDGAPRPHAMPVWGVWVDGTVCFSTDPSSRKGRNLVANPALVIHLESGDEAVVLEGAAEQVTDLATLQPVLDAYEQKYTYRPDTGNPAYGWYRLRLRKAFAWLESDFPGGATRWRFDE
jgi:hypothetical protein